LKFATFPQWWTGFEWLEWSHRRLARLSADQSRKAHVDAAREAWRSIKRDDLVAELDKEFGPE
jgi:hypothetical protein